MSGSSNSAASFRVLFLERDRIIAPLSFDSRARVPRHKRLRKSAIGVPIFVLPFPFGFRRCALNSRGRPLRPHGCAPRRPAVPDCRSPSTLRGRSTPASFFTVRAEFARLPNLHPCGAQHDHSLTSSALLRWRFFQTSEAPRDLRSRVSSATVPHKISSRPAATLFDRKIAVRR